MPPVDHEAETIGAAGSTALTRVQHAKGGSSAPRTVQDTQPLDPNAERYAIQSLLGEGGMGEVHLCRDARIERSVAMKVARGGVDMPDEVRMRFIHEARVQGQLEHPAIVPVYDLGVRADGSLFFTMKRVRGHTLADVVSSLRELDESASKLFTRRRLLTAFSNVCMAIHFAHTRGVLHRDLKPSNVMLGDFGEVYVLDWGLARVIGEAEREVRPETIDDEETMRARISGTSGSGFTVDGAILGTPGYMSPEQAMGRLDELDARTDVYALGAILFELLTLERLHERESVGLLLRATLEGADARATVRAPGREVPPELEALCVKATATKREERFATVGEMARAIERYLDGDRDLERRRELSTEHARAAGEAAKRAAGGGANSVADHAEAMREVGRAIVMDPHNVEAMRTLVALLSHTPAQIPDEARATLEADRRALQREGGRLGGVAYASWLLYVPLALWMGIKNLPLALAVLFGGLVTAVLSFRLMRKPTSDARVPYSLMLASFTAIGLFSLAFGPFVLVAGMVAINAVAFILGAGKLRRTQTIALAVITLMIPPVLEWLNVIPRSYALTADGLVIIPRVLAFSKPATEIFLVVANVAFVITTSLTVAHARDALSTAEEKLHFHAWQLRQLVPPGDAKE